jgi:GNAT superfamily N-acetyltransferase
MLLVTTTYLEMRSPQELRPRRCNDDRFRIGERPAREWEFNRNLYIVVGENWSWNDKRGWTDAQWKEYAESPLLRTFSAHYDNALAGYYELRHDDSGVEIAYFGLLPAFIGRGFGGATLTNAIEEAWRMSPSRVWVHTCSLDHPAALANYQARGMKIYKIEPPQ